MFALGLIDIRMRAGFADLIIPVGLRRRAFIAPRAALIFLLPFPLELIRVAERNGRRSDSIYRVCHISPSPTDLACLRANHCKLIGLLNPHRFHARFRVARRRGPRAFSQRRRLRIEAEQRAQVNDYLFENLTDPSLTKI